jgi:hypothetical protein
MAEKEAAGGTMIWKLNTDNILSLANPFTFGCRSFCILAILLHTVDLLSTEIHPHQLVSCL